MNLILRTTGKQCRSDQHFPTVMLRDAAPADRKIVKMVSLSILDDDFLKAPLCSRRNSLQFICSIEIGSVHRICLLPDRVWPVLKSISALEGCSGSGDDAGSGDEITAMQDLSPNAKRDRLYFVLFDAFARRRDGGEEALGLQIPGDCSHGRRLLEACVHERGMGSGLTTKRSSLMTCS